MDMQEMRDERSHLIRNSEDILKNAEKEGRPLTQQEQRDTDDYIAKASAISDQIEAFEASERQAKKIRDVAATLRTPEQRVAPPIDPNAPHAPSVEGGYKRFGKLKAFTRYNETAKNEEAAYNAGLFLCRLFGRTPEGEKTKMAVWAERRMRERGIEFRTQTEGSNTAGGALVPEEMAQAVIDLRETYGVFRQNVGVRPMTSDTIVIPRRTGGLTTYWVNEGVAVTESNKTWNNVRLVAKKLGALSYISTELAEDALINVADDLAQEMAYAFAVKEDQCGFIGDGTSTYNGIVGIATEFNNDTTLAGAVAATATQDTFPEVTAASIAAAMGKLPLYARMNAKFYCSSDAFDGIFGRLMAAGGGNTIQTLGGGYQRQYLGYPIEISQVLPTSATDAQAMFLFGDLSQAVTMGNRREIVISRSDDIKFEEDLIGIKATQRFDINVHDVGTSSVAGPVVALMANTS